MSDKHGRTRGPSRIESVLRAFLQNEQGVAAVEFAIISIPFFLMIMAIIELGLLLFNQIALEYMVNSVARTTTIGSRPPMCSAQLSRPDCMAKLLESKTKKLIYGKNVVISFDTVDSKASAYIEPELCLKPAPAHFAKVCKGPFEDTNGNGVYDPGNLGKDAGTGKGELVQIDVALPWQFFTPFIGQFFTLSNVKSGEEGASYDAYVIRTSALVKNEPFGVTP